MTIRPSTFLALLLATAALATAHAPRGLAAQSTSPEHQIAAAVKAAPPGEAEGATVLGYDAGGTLTTLRRGSNAFVCLADDPSAEGWSVACYHESLEPFMARGRELRAQGVSDAGELARRRWAEADAGTLSMPEEPAMLYVMTGDGFDPSSGTVANPFTRWVVYTPWATPESTGISSRPTAPGAPWLMFPGTAGAHIMITPPVPGG